MEGGMLILREKLLSVWMEEGGGGGDVFESLPIPMDEMRMNDCLLRGACDLCLEWRVKAEWSRPWKEMG